MPFLIFFCAVMIYLYAEISLLVSVGSHLGVLATILLLLAVSFAGLWLVRLRGLYTVFALRQQLMKGQIPTTAIVDSLLFVLAGVLLIIPGFLSDLLALFCLLPFTRRLVRHGFIAFFKKRIKFARFSSFHTNGFGQENTTFEAEFERQQDTDKRIK